MCVVFVILDIFCSTTRTVNISLLIFFVCMDCYIILTNTTANALISKDD